MGAICVRAECLRKLGLAEPAPIRPVVMTMRAATSSKRCQWFDRCTSSGMAAFRYVAGLRQKMVAFTVTDVSLLFLKRQNQTEVA